FISKAIGTYAPIAGMNLIFIIIPLIATIKFFNIPPIDYLVNILFVIVGLISVKDLVSMIAELIGADDTLKSGGAIASEVASTAVTAGKVAMGPARFAVGAGKMIKSFGKFGVDKIKQSRDHKAEEGAVLNDVMNDPTSKAEFENLSTRKQKKFLKTARLSMSDEDRTKAHEEGNIYRDVRKSVYGSGSSGVYSFKSSSEFKKDQEEKSEVKLKRRLNRAGKLDDYKSSKSDLQEYETDYNTLKSTPEYASLQNKKRKMADTNKAFAEGKLTKTKRNNMLRKIRFTDEEKNAAHEEQKFKAVIDTEKSNLSSIANGVAKVKTPNRYERFVASQLGAKGSDERATAEQRASDRKIAEKTQYGGGSALFKNALNNDFKETLKSIFKSLGGDFMKGWKEAGGWGAIINSLKGAAAEKKASEKQATNEQIKMLKAQREAQSVVDGGKSSGSSSSSKIDISERV
ncbi:MAG: hypothetical protein PHS54_07030, partial [Clostridia bacterium]|nr:hypothetical protein [Clostridia bacterium]